MTPERKLTPEQAKLAEAYMPWARAYVERTYRPTNREARENLYSAAYEGLVRAALVWEDRGNSFTNYARHWVFKQCNEMIGLDHTIRPPWKDIKAANVEHDFDMVPLDVVADEDNDNLNLSDLIGFEDEGYALVEDDMMLRWITDKVFTNYSQATIDAWFAWRRGASLPTEEDLAACVQILNDEIQEGFLE